MPATALFECKRSPVLWIAVPEALCEGIAGYLQLRDLKPRAHHQMPFPFPQVVISEFHYKLQQGLSGLTGWQCRWKIHSVVKNVTQKCPVNGSNLPLRGRLSRYYYSFYCQIILWAACLTSYVTFRSCIVSRIDSYTGTAALSVHNLEAPFIIGII